MLFQPHNYQRSALQWLVNRTLVEGHNGAGFFLDPGLGKTSITLCWLKLLRELGLAKRVLIVAPLRVVYSVWPNECEKWGQFRSTRISIIHGSELTRKHAINRDADLYLINPEGVPWLKENFPANYFQALVLDESTKFKSWSSQRTKSLRKLIPHFQYRLILTGTPSPNSLSDLFSQLYVVDRGESLGTTVSQFRNRYFYRGGYKGYRWIAYDGSSKAVQKLIAPLCLRLNAKDHIDLPELLTNDIWVDLPEEWQEKYKIFEREMFIELDKNGLTASNAGSKYMSCRQIANGGLYDENKQSVHLHNAKVEAVIDLIDELQGKPVLIAFQFRHDLERLRKYIDIPSIDGTTKARQAADLIDGWNASKLSALAVQPKSLSHGVNMQSGSGRDIIWVGLTDSLEDYLQFIARIYRQGVSGQVRVHRILARRTVDEAMRIRIESKDAAQSALLDSLEQYRSQHGIETNHSRSRAERNSGVPQSGR